MVCVLKRRCNEHVMHAKVFINNILFPEVILIV